MEAFVDTRSRNVVIKRMIQLGLIADRSEILPSKRRKALKSAQTPNSDESSDDDIAESRPVKITIKNVKTKKATKPNPIATVRKVNTIPLNVSAVQQLISELDENIKENLEWIQESLHDASEDAEDASEDPDDGVPLVPFTASQREAFENEKFKEFLLALGFQKPISQMVNCLPNLNSLTYFISIFFR